MKNIITWFSTYQEKMKKRTLRIHRNIEAARLRRARRKRGLAYTYCKNCGTKLKGMYCHRCGQYALDIYQPFWKYIQQYFENVYQFDTKVWQTLWLMFTRPGFLTREFNAGKINSYVHPFRLYMFVSVLFFTFFFMVAEDRDVLLFAVPSVFVRSTARKAAPHIPDGQLIVDVAKGVEEKTLMTMSEIIEQELAADGKHTHCNVVALSGPTHAEEVARDMPTLIVAGSPDEAAARKVQQIFTTPTFRVYTNTDRRGVELGGAVKNVIALAVGIAMGLDYGDNAKAALITRGNAELARLGVAMGCKAETFAGLSGMGDLIVTCTSMHSRNLHAGMLIGRGKDVETAKKDVGQVVEGINALPAACKLAKKYKVEMPIVNAVDDILSGRLAARDALATMMGRQLKQE